MSAFNQVPSLDDRLPFLHHFIIELVEDYRSGKINSWDEIDKAVKVFFTSERMKEMEEIVRSHSKEKGIMPMHFAPQLPRREYYPSSDFLLHLNTIC
jgi:hypothetical protein